MGKREKFESIGSPDSNEEGSKVQVYSSKSDSSNFNQSILSATNISLKSTNNKQKRQNPKKMKEIQFITNFENEVKTLKDALKKNRNSENFSEKLNPEEIDEGLTPISEYVTELLKKNNNVTLTFSILIDSQNNYFLFYSKVKGNIETKRFIIPFKSLDEAADIYENKIKVKLINGYYNPAQKPEEVNQEVIITNTLLNLLTDKTIIQKNIISFGLDNAKIKIGSVPEERLKKALDILNEIKKQIEKTSVKKHTFAELTFSFYNAIPHKFSSNKLKANIIDSMPKVNQKLSLIYSLRNINWLFESMKSSAFIDDIIEKFEVVHPTSEEFEKISSYADNFLEIIDIYEVKEEKERTKKEKILLWHGTQIENCLSIIARGFTYPNNKVVLTDDIMRELNGNFPWDKKQGCILLCEVDIDDIKEFYPQEIDEKIKEGLESYKVKGKIEYASKDYVKEKEIYIPSDPNFCDNENDYELDDCNTYVIKNCSKVKVRYVVKVKQSCDSGWLKV